MQRRTTAAVTHGWLWTIRRDFIRNKYVYLMAAPVMIFFVLFHYVPMYGAIIAFERFTPADGVFRSPWVGLKYFRDFFGSYYFWRLLRNTFSISFYSLVVGFPAPIILALLLNEVTHARFKRTVQSLTYLPHFVSLIVICGMLVQFTQRDGVINDVVAFFGGKRVTMLSRPEYFQPLYVASGVWQEIGWESIIYLAALAAVDPSLYEAAIVDGANRFQRLWGITLPSILPTIVILLILSIGRLFSVGYEKILLLYNPTVYETADVISTFVYRKGLIDFGWSYATAVGLFNSAANLTLLLIANTLSRRVSETSLW
jgi:putative aldouronate transport system permease protein